jgi:hypothetical protein
VPVTNDASATIRGKLRENRLPRAVPLRAHILEGDGRHCSGCGMPIKIGSKMWELEVSGGPIIQFHEECEQIWRQETGN